MSRYTGTHTHTTPHQSCKAHKRLLLSTFSTELTLWRFTVLCTLWTPPPFHPFQPHQTVYTTLTLLYVIVNAQLVPTASLNQSKESVLHYFFTQTFPVLPSCWSLLWNDNPHSFAASIFRKTRARLLLSTAPGTRKRVYHGLPWKERMPEYVCRVRSLRWRGCQNR